MQAARAESLRIIWNRHLKSLGFCLVWLAALALPGCRETGAPHRGAEELLTAHFAQAKASVLGEQEAALFRPGAEGFEIEGANASLLRVSLPPEGGGEVRMELAGGLTVRVREREGSGSGRLVGSRQGAILYEGQGRSSIWTARERGVEHWVLVERPIQSQVASYTVQGARLRQAGERVEVLDARGRVRLTVSAPRAFAADGTPVHVRLAAVEDRLELFAEAATDAPLLVDPFWEITGALATARSNHTATVLADGTVLVTGGSGACCPRLPLTLAERYDPATGTWAASAAMSTSRSRHTATLLSDNSTLLVAGGVTGDGTATTGSAERFNTGTGSWSSAGALTNSRVNHTATLLASGQVLVTGGESGNLTLNTAELYSTSTNSWTITTPMSDRRSFHTATLLPNGRVLVTGGANSSVTLSSAELYAPTLATWDPMARMSVPRRHHTATLLADGRVLVVGGINDNGLPAHAEIYDPAANTWTPTGSLAFPRYEHTATLLPDGKVLIAGGREPLRSRPEVYDVTTGTFRVTGCLLDPRASHTANVVSTSPTRVLVAGGIAAQALSSSELYDPVGGFPVGAVCDSDCDCTDGFCEDGFCCDSRCGGACDSCDGRNGTASPGTCAFSPDGDPGTPSCTPYLCAATSADCPTTCVDDTDCVASHRCEANRCVPRKSPGTPCSNDLECASQMCVDGVCCTSRCEGACNACNLPGSAGTCTNLPRGTQGSPSCSPYTCQGGSNCPSSCRTNEDCAPGYACQDGQCVPGQPIGQPCTQPGQCASGFCSDGVCCDEACEGACNACNLPGKEGRCSNLPVGAVGEPICAPFTCSGASECRTSCRSDEECAEGARCKRGVCVAGRAGYLGYSRSCSIGSGPEGLWPLAVVLLLPLLARRRPALRRQGAVLLLSLLVGVAGLLPAEVLAQGAPDTAGASSTRRKGSKKAVSKKQKKPRKPATPQAPPPEDTGAAQAAGEPSSPEASGTAAAPGTVGGSPDSSPPPPGDTPLASPVAAQEPPAPEPTASQAAPQEAPATKVAELEEEAPGKLGRLHLGFSLFGEFVSRQVGGEVAISYSVLRWLDVGIGTPVGEHIGGRVMLTFQRPRARGATFSPFLQLRGVVHPVKGGTGLGGGAWAGGSMEFGPGRLRVGALGEAYQGPPGFFPYAAVAMLGYELDPFRTRVEQYERTRVLVEQAPRPTTGVLRGQVMDLEDKPLTGEVLVSAEGLEPQRLEARPDFSLTLPPGTYEVQATATGYLARARSFTLAAGETIVSDFQLRPAPLVPTAKLTEEQIEVSQKLPFEFRAARILPEAYPMLDEVVDILVRNSHLTVRIVGHTDNVGTAEYNQKLSEARARSVRDYLVEKGIAPKRLSTQGFGASKPLTSNATEEGRAKNRRVQFEIIGR